MNIQFNSLEINDFQSIGKAKIDLDNLGTTLVKGKNDYEENTTSNGSGKSSIFEALYFSLFGKTTTGLTNVSNRYTGNTYKLVLDFILDNVKYQIIRDGTKVTLLENDIDISRRNKTDTDSYIRDNILKISPEVFLNIIYLAQGFKSRLSALTAGGRKDQIEEIIGTNEITEEFRQQIQSLKEKLNTELNELNSKKSYNEGTITQINSNIQSYKNEIDRILMERAAQPSKEEITNKINNIKIDLSNEEQNQIDITNKITEIKDENNSKQLDIANINNIISQYEAEINNEKNIINNKLTEFQRVKAEEYTQIEKDYSNSSSECNNNISILRVQNDNFLVKIRENKNSIETLKTSDTCPTCGRKFENANEEHILNEVQKLINSNIECENKIKENNNKIEEENIKIQTATDLRNGKCETLSKEISEFKSGIDKELEQVDLKLKEFKINKEKEKSEIQAQIKDISTEMGTLNAIISRINQYKSNILVLENQLNNIKEESTENYEKMIKESTNKLIEISKENEEFNKQITEVTEKIGVATHCGSLVSKEFKNYLLKSAIEFLNSRLQYYSALLFSNQEDRVKFIQEGTKLDIYLGDALFESLSGGEKRKVDIAIMLVQKELANNMSNTYSNILILDEVTDGLDSKSIDVVTSILMQVSKDINSMFIVSHKDTTIGYDTQILVTKGKNRVSSVEIF